MSRLPIAPALAPCSEDGDRKTGRAHHFAQASLRAARAFTVKTKKKKSSFRIISKPAKPKMIKEEYKMNKIKKIFLVMASLTFFEIYAAPEKKTVQPAESVAVKAEPTTEIPGLPDFSIYHISYLGSLTNSGKKTINILNGEVLEKSMSLSYNGVIGIEKNILRGLGGFIEYGFSQKLLDIKYSGPSGGNYWFFNSQDPRNLTAVKVEANFRLTAGLSYSWRIRKYIIFQGSLGYVNVNQLTYAENRATPPLTVTQSFGANYISHDPKNDAIRTDATFHGMAVMANFILTPFDAVHFPVSIRYNTIFTPTKFAENAQLPASVQELWIGTGVRLVI